MNERNRSAADEEFARQAKTHFDESVSNLDAATRSKLNRGRQAALAELASGGSRWMRWAPAAGVAAAAVVAVMVWTGSPTGGEAVPAPGGDIEILLTEESFEMLEDLEFYSWIELDEESEGQNGNVG